MKFVGGTKSMVMDFAPALRHYLYILHGKFNHVITVHFTIVDFSSSAMDLYLLYTSSSNH